MSNSLKTHTKEWSSQVAQAPSPNKHFHVLEINENFEEVDGKFEYIGTLIVYEAEDGLHMLGISSDRNISRTNINPNHLKNDIRIPKSAYSPEFNRFQGFYTHPWTTVTATY